MNCDECRQQLHAFLDNEVDDDVQDFLRKHLGGCIPCYQRSELEAALRRTIKARVKHAPLPHGLEDRLRAALARSTDPIPGPSDGGKGVPPAAWAVFATAAAAGLLLATLAPNLVAKTAPSAAEIAVPANPVQVRGTVQCVGCSLSSTGRSTCEQLAPNGGLAGSAHVLRQLRASDGTTWQLVPTEATAAALADHGCDGKAAFVLGTAHPRAHALEVARLTFE